MIFKGIGVVWDINKAHPLVNFRYTETYETDDPREIELLKKAHGIEIIGEEVAHKATRKDLVAKAKEAGIKGADRMSKAELMGALA